MKSKFLVATRIDVEVDPEVWYGMTQHQRVAALQQAASDGAIAYFDDAEIERTALRRSHSR